MRQLFGHLPGKQLLWTAAEGGRWLSTQQCLFPDAACLLESGSTDTTASSSASDVDGTANSTVAVAQQNSGGGDAGSSGGFGPLGQALVQLGLPLAVLPSSVLHMMKKYLVRGSVAYSDVRLLLVLRAFVLSCQSSQLPVCCTCMPFGNSWVPCMCSPPPVVFSVLAARAAAAVLAISRPPRRQGPP